MATFSDNLGEVGLTIPKLLKKSRRVKTKTNKPDTHTHNSKEATKRQQKIIQKHELEILRS